MKNEKQTRLDQLEVDKKFGVMPDATLIRKARAASVALFRYDTLRCGSLEHRGGRDYEVRIEMVDETNGRRCGSETGENIAPHFFRAGHDARGEYFLADCGRVKDASVAARKVCEDLCRWFAGRGRADVCARFGGSLRYIVIARTGEEYGDTYALID